MSDALWYKHAIIYQLHVRSFFDSVDDGIGDFGGLTQKLDYLQDLGITAIWIQPFYPSPLRDDGYDIADYQNINPQYGTLDLFRQFLDAAHQRDLKVITELVINHTSDQHAWFQRARRAPPGSALRDFYVWSDTPEKYRDARIIFKDFETSNWTYDNVAKAYFWHRFYSHQPDLNYDNPAVRQAIFPLLDFWLEMGVDGLRLDAVPYLFEREGTNCENLPETHAYLKDLRRHVDERFPNRMLLAEANQWPEDAVAYFGDGDECHMAFHFPVMPRLFMAIHREDRFPIIDIMDQTPALPANCQWAMFLRNHDELTLEMVTDEERDYMYRAYANDTQARINLGIRRRLAPLLSNNRRRIELMNGLLFSMPGTPIIYYGDEIGMGDNVYLGDRNGVRTPMQWSADRNAGFSRANPQKLFLPINIDPEYHYEAVNVEAQQNNPHSLLWWTKRLIDMRKQWPALSEGTIEFLHPDNRKVLAFLRKLDDQTVLVVANLSRFVQYVELDLTAYSGAVPIELFGGTRLPPVGKAPYFLSLGPHSFLWFQLSPATQDQRCAVGDEYLERLPVLAARRSWHELAHREEDRLEGALATYLSCRLAPTGSPRPVKAVHVRDVAQLPVGSQEASLVLLDADLATGEVQRSALPLLLATDGRAEQLAKSNPSAAIARIAGAQQGLLYDAAGDPDLALALVELVLGQRRLVTRGGSELRGWRLAGAGVAEEAFAPAVPVPMSFRHANVSLNFSNRLILKILRNAEEGVHPEVEFGRFFHTAVSSLPLPRLVGGIDLVGPRGQAATLALVHEFVLHEADGWRHASDALGDFFERVSTLDPAIAPPPRTDWRQPSPPAASPQDASLLDELIPDELEAARLLGRRTAEMHLVLASDREHLQFAPESFSPFYQRSIYQSMRSQALVTLDELRRRLASFDETTKAPAAALVGQQAAILASFRRVLAERLETVRIRCHGDFHLQQVLFTGKDFVIIDFEGDARDPLSERRIKRSPLRDVASMMRSFDYVARAALAGLAEGDTAPRGAVRAIDRARVAQWNRLWVARVMSAYLEGYEQQPGIAALLPPHRQGLVTLLETFLLERSLSDLEHELRERPVWVPIALESALDVLADSRSE